MERRALWDQIVIPTSTASKPSLSTTALCSRYTLPSAGVISFGSSSLMTISSDVVFLPLCTKAASLAGSGGPSSSKDFRDPFYASTIPTVFALAATTVISYMLVIVLLITPRTFLSGGTIILGRRGFTNGPSSRDSGIGIGGRPWLQKVAALTVAISLTIATANTFRVAEEQYENGTPSATALQALVLNGMELKIIRVISDAFLWLAQAQTLIRLFPRQREKIIIKWTALGLIVLDTTFSILNTFVAPWNYSRPHNFADSIPALSYLFELALGVLYCAWVLYYSITKRTYAFYHPQMRNICLVAFISVIALIVPVVFFVLDISKPDVAGWGDYVRWVGAAAASVVVWEWVERIEALERNEKKDGVLGREIFDGDEMLEVTPSSDTRPPRRTRRNDGDRNSSTTIRTAGSTWPAAAGTAFRYRLQAPNHSEIHNTGTTGNECCGIQGRQTVSILPPSWPSQSPLAATPISRADTSSADSTIYTVHYHPISDLQGTSYETNRQALPSGGGSFDLESQHDRRTSDSADDEKDIASEPGGQSRTHHQAAVGRALQKVNPFQNKNQKNPGISAHTRKVQNPLDDRATPYKWDILGKIEDFAALQADRLWDKARTTPDIASLPVTRIPAPQRCRTLTEIAEEQNSSQGGQEGYFVNSTAANVASASANVSFCPAQTSQNQRTSLNVDTDVTADQRSLYFIASVHQELDSRVDETVESLDQVQQCNISLQNPHTSSLQSITSSNSRPS